MHDDGDDDGDDDMPRDLAAAWAKIADHIAFVLLATPWSAGDLYQAVSALVGANRRASTKRLIDELLANSYRYPPNPAALAAAVQACPSFEAAMRDLIAAPWLLKQPLAPPLFAPSARFANLDIPQLPTSAALAHWLGITPAHLGWYAGTRRPHDPTMIPILQHYTYMFIPKKRGPPRLIESPKPRLKTMQRRILDHILAAVPNHPSAHGFVRGRSALSGAQVHAGEAMVIAADLADFFPSTPLRRVHGLFRSLGYPSAVARALTGLCSAATPEAVFLRRASSEGHSVTARKIFAARHLPQGAPTSPALANLCAWPLDQRLAGLALSLGANYTRYADDLSFSGDAVFAQRADGVLTLVARIAEEEGYGLNPAKTRQMPAHQRQTVTGIVVNAHNNIAREHFDALKAILHNCLRHGPASQNRAAAADFRAHLDGRIGWVEQVNPRRGARLRQMFERLGW